MSCGEADHWMYANGRALERIEILWDKDENIQGYTKEMALKQRDRKILLDKYVFACALERL